MDGKWIAAALNWLVLFGAPHLQHPALQGGVAESFSDLRLREDVVTALRNSGMTQPTIIQVRHS